MTIDDILHSTPKFWRAHMDNIIVRDTTAHMLLTIQYNLVAGSVAPFAVQRQDLRPLMDEILNFDVSYILPQTTLAGPQLNCLQ